MLYAVMCLGKVDDTKNNDEIIKCLEEDMALDIYQAGLTLNHGYILETGISQEDAKNQIQQLEKCGIRAMITEQNSANNEKSAVSETTAGEDFITAFDIDMNQRPKVLFNTKNLAFADLKNKQIEWPVLQPELLYPTEYNTKQNIMLLIAGLFSSLLPMLLIPLIIYSGLSPDVLKQWSFIVCQYIIVAFICGFTFRRLLDQCKQLPATIIDKIALIIGLLAALNYTLFNHMIFDNNNLPLFIIFICIAISAWITRYINHNHLSWFYTHNQIELNAQKISSLSYSGVCAAVAAMSQNNFNALLSISERYPGNQADIILYHHQESQAAYLNIVYNYSVNYKAPQAGEINKQWLVTSTLIYQPLIDFVINGKEKSRTTYLALIQQSEKIISKDLEQTVASTSINTTMTATALTVLLIIPAVTRYFFIQKEIQEPVIILVTPIGKPPPVTPVKPVITEAEIAVEADRTRRQNILNLNSTAAIAFKKNQFDEALKNINEVLIIDKEDVLANKILDKIIKKYTQQLKQHLYQYEISLSAQMLDKIQVILLRHPNKKSPIAELKAQYEHINALNKLTHKTQAALLKKDYQLAYQHLLAIQMLDKNYPHYQEYSIQLAEHYLKLATSAINTWNRQNATKYIQKTKDIVTHLNLNFPLLNKRDKQLNNWVKYPIDSIKKKFYTHKIRVEYMDGRTITGQLIGINKKHIQLKRNVTGKTSYNAIEWIDILEITIVE